MKPWIFDDFKQFLDEVEIKNLCEIGTHKGNTAVQMILHLLEKNNDLVYHGYDVFDYARNNLKFNRQEYNGKGGASKQLVIKYEKTDAMLQEIKVTVIKPNTILKTMTEGISVSYCEKFK